MIGHLIDRHLVVVHGSSGSGKSSLIRAGVLPRLEQDYAGRGLSWRTSATVPGRDPLRNVANALAVLEETEPKPSRIRDLRLLLNRGRYAATILTEQFRRREHDHMCVLIDQFEELFAFARTSREEAAFRRHPGGRTNINCLIISDPERFLTNVRAARPS